MKTLLQTLNETLICGYGFVIGPDTEVLKKLECDVWNVMCQRGQVHVGFFSRSTIVLISTLRVNNDDGRKTVQKTIYKNK